MFRWLDELTVSVELCVCVCVQSLLLQQCPLDHCTSSTDIQQQGSPTYLSKRWGFAGGCKDIFKVLPLLLQILLHLHTTNHLLVSSALVSSGTNTHTHTNTPTVVHSYSHPRLLTDTPPPHQRHSLSWCHLSDSLQISDL